MASEKFGDIVSARGKQNYDYWQIIFETGKSPQRLQIMPQGLNLDELLKE